VSRVRVTQVRSRNGADRRQVATLRSLGLRRINHAVEHEQTPQIAGMLHAVRHLVRVEPVGEVARDG
jgi:large subunit ribosomal protein L30